MKKSSNYILAHVLQETLAATSKAAAAQGTKCPSSGE
jgi:hypothetical protein